MNIKEANIYGIETLKNGNVKEPIIKARTILSFTIKKDRIYLLMHENEEVKEEQLQEYKSSIQRLIQGEPLQHITHMQEFMKMNFYVDENVLIPRPDTEILVEEVIEISNSFINPKLLDLCTGSGAIAIALSNNIRNADVTATDISKKAIEIAKKNDSNKKIKFIESNLFNKITGKFDIIVSNPPYIRTDEIQNLDLEVQKEPKIALDGGTDGLEFYKKIIENAYSFLNTGGYLCFEIGYDQKEEVVDLFKKTKKYENIYFKKDLNNNDRIVCARKKVL